MFHKETLKTKTFWAGVAAIVSGIGMIFTGEGDRFQALQIIIGGVIACTGRDALTSNSKGGN